MMEHDFRTLEFAGRVLGLTSIAQIVAMVMTNVWLYKLTPQEPSTIQFLFSCRLLMAGGLFISSLLGIVFLTLARRAKRQEDREDQDLADVFKNYISERHSNV